MIFLPFLVEKYHYFNYTGEVTQGIINHFQSGERLNTLHYFFSLTVHQQFQHRHKHNGKIHPDNEVLF